jgi:predicted ArsR family transcriptional regulator
MVAALRHRLLAVVDAPCTARAAAERLGAPVGRLYHHLDRLLAAGLVEVVGERRRRGAIERTFRATGGHAAAVTLRLTPERLAFLRDRLSQLLAPLESADGVETEILLIATPKA